MARINIEECWWSDPRRSKLIKLVGCEEMADGIAVKMWRIAQEFWKRDRQLIPEQIFQSLEFAEQLISSGLAKLQDGFVYARGSSQYLEWVNEKQKAGRQGGKKSAERLRDAKGRMRPSKESKQNPSRVQAESKQDPSRSKHVQASDSDSFSDSDSSKNTNTYSVGEEASASSLVPENLGSGKELTKAEKKARKAIANKEAGENIQTFIATYVKSYQTAYPAKGGGPRPRPDLTGKVQGQIKKYLAEVPIERACELIQVYCQMEDQWFKTKCHDIGSFIENQNKISLALDTGAENSKPVRKSITEILRSPP